MFRYSRDVKRCGPGTKAGAPVGVVYCLSTSSFFILMLTLELNVSAFGVAAGLSNMLAEFNAGQYEPLGSSLQAGSSQNHELRLGGHARRNSSALQQSLSGFFGFVGRQRFSKALAHPIKTDL